MLKALFNSSCLISSSSVSSTAGCYSTHPYQSEHVGFFFLASSSAIFFAEQTVNGLLTFSTLFSSCINKDSYPVPVTLVPLSSLSLKEQGYSCTICLAISRSFALPGHIFSLQRTSSIITQTSSLLSLGFGLFFSLKASMRLGGILCPGTAYGSQGGE